MENKCSKYEALFTFSDEQALMQHIAQCEDCKAEHEKMQKVSALISEVKPYFYRKKYQKLKVAICGLFIFLVSGISIQIADVEYGFLDTVKYGQQLSMSDLGIPTDDYGLIMVE